MSHNVDIDEADVAVLNQNLGKSKELFSALSQSLNNISKKSATASTKIKPVLRDVNKLNNNKQQIDKGLELLKDVSNYASKASQYESVLNNSIDLIGLKKFLDTLIKSQKLLKEMKVNIKNFTGILINFENSIDKSQGTLISYFKKSINKLNLLNNGSLKTNQDIYLIINYFYNRSNSEKQQINEVFVKALLKQISSLLLQHAAKCTPLKRSPGVPYERGSNGINLYIKETNQVIDTIVTLLNDMVSNLSNFDEILKDRLLQEILGGLINEEMSKIVDNYGGLMSNLIDNDVLILEVIERLNEFERKLNVNNLVISKFPKYRESYERLLNGGREIFKELVQFAEAKINKVEKINERTIPEITVELISRERKISEFNKALNILIKGSKLGGWLDIKPNGVKFVNVYTSVVPITPESGIDETSSEFLLLSYFSDLIDCIMINIEIGIKNNNSNNSEMMKKSTQGFHLIKNMILIENIISRSNLLFTSLGSIGIERINKLKNRFLKLFLDDWNYASYIIIRDMTAITTTNAMNSNNSSGFSNKEREQIKELFKNFNESFEEAIKNYEKFSITDNSLRNYLKNEIKKLIINAYFKLYDKYGQSDFTKNKPKYVKYDKQQFENILNQKL